MTVGVVLGALPPCARGGLGPIVLFERMSAKDHFAESGVLQLPPGRDGPRREHPDGDIERAHGGQVAEIQRARLLSAMLEVVAERGAANVTVAHVVERAGVSRRTFYEVFLDCEDCLLAALDHALARAWEHLRYSHDPGAGWVERIRVSLFGLLCFLDDEPSMGRLLVVESLGAGPKALQRRSRALAEMVAAVDEGRALTVTGKSSKNGSATSSLVAEGVVGAVLSILHTRLLQGSPGLLTDLTSQLMSMIVLPYLGPSAARGELQRPIPERDGAVSRAHATPDTLRELPMRLTYRTVRVLLAISSQPGASNRVVGAHAGISDQGQISKLLARLERLGLAANDRDPHIRGAPNMWTLTPKGQSVVNALRVEP